MSTFEIPRLTGSLRAFSGFSSPLNETKLKDRERGDRELQRKRKWRAEQEAKKGLTWDKLQRIFDQKTAKGNRTEAIKLLRDLRQVASRLVGGEISEEEVEATAALLFQNLKDCEQIGHQETLKLKKIFGPFPASDATKACAIIQRLSTFLPEEELDNLSSNGSEDDTTNKRKEFGSNIQFKFPSQTDNHVESDSDSDEDSPSGLFSLSQWADRKPPPPVIEAPTIDALWLLRECEKCFGSRTSVSVLDMCSAIFDVLCSGRSNEEIQGDLFDLVGFDQFEFIQSLLGNRSDIVAATTENASEYGLRKGEGASQSSGTSISQQPKPTFGCQVTIQSEQEKQFLKASRKEEKKLIRKLEKTIEDVEHEEYLRALGFDPEEMKVKRETALEQASVIPLFSKRERASPRASEVYPHVYDSMISAQGCPSFIAGAKMLLPAGAERKNERLYEEVAVPPDSTTPPTAGLDFISISDLDDIAKMAFQGMKKLNRIQSIVFDAAYNTNENLLISAPTGAGKTNIAMLTILHEINQNIQQGVIKKDQFKVVYIAPMKALAAEMVANFGRRLAPLGITVKELTGDMQLTKAEILKTQMLVTTPEKWDVVTRKSTGDVALAQLVKLLIIDEVHLLHDDRGSVIECLVARTLRQVESSQSMIRIVGLSATLPNYLDVARFLNVNPYQGLFFFDGRFRPVPLGQTFIGVKGTGGFQKMQNMNTVCYEKVLDNVERGHQVMVFVHARNATVRTALALREMAANQGDSALFRANQDPQFGLAQKQVMKSRNKEMKDLFSDGFSTHHAGMLRQDRTLVESLFSKGIIKVLVCTATLAWGVNLPAHAVVIKGTEIYDAKRGAFVDLGMLDVLQIFGRAGRPQFDTHGEGIIITSHDKLSHYLSLLTRQTPIESQLQGSLTDSLNAEISLGTVTNMEEGVKWLSYTYLFTRMLLNPLVYGLGHDARDLDPLLEKHREVLITNAARALDKAHMVRFDERTGYLSATDLGRTASNFYIKYATIEVFNEMFKPHMTEADILGMISHSQEFEQIKVREEEIPELQDHVHDNCVFIPKGGVENSYGKVNILMQTYVSRGHMESFSLVSDQAYVAQNSGRIVRALFEIALHKGWPAMTAKLLTLCKTLDKRLWGYENSLRQFSILTPETLNKLEARKMTIDRLKDMDPKEIGLMINHVRMGNIIKKCVTSFPCISLAASIQPITRTVLRVRLEITPEFMWDDKLHGSTSEPWWIWVEDPENNHIYHSEYFLIQKKQVQSRETQSLVFTIPIFEPLPPQYYVRAISDRWLSAEAVCAISFQHLILPEKHPPHTDLLDLQPLSVRALKSPTFEALFNFTHFNPIQTQIFHTLYHTDHNVLLGAPTGSGKTIAAELAIFRIFNVYPNTKAVYIAPLKALVRERMEDWRVRFEEKLGKKVVELTGDVTPDMRAISQADVIVTTPEKWDGVSRSWQNRSYVKAVTLLVIDEIHLLGNDRGPVLEVIVSRTNFISSHTESGVRVVGLSTALANARDLADWLNIGQAGLFNFRPSVRPVPLEVHINGFPGKHYCPRMATMNKPAFAAIRTHSPAKPTLIFVSSRRQTRLTALDLIAYLAAEEDSKQWLHTSENEMDNLIRMIHDENLKLTLSFGIGLHHAGLHERDRKTVEELFVNQKIQILIATSTLAWGVNFPAHLVIVKGTEYFDGKTCRYVDFPITDVLQMMGRAGRPQFDDQGVAVILVHDVKKHFYKKFLYEPFPVESNLLEVLSDHLNAEVVSGTVTSKQDAMDYITWTYFFRRLVMNPSYYELEDTDHTTINNFLSQLVEKSIQSLEMSYCLELEEDNRGLTPTTLGRIASYYYLSHETVRMFRDRMFAEATIQELLVILTDAEEYAELPVRHNEDALNSELAKQLPIEVDAYSYDSAHTKAHLLFQAHFSRIALPSSDYFTDTKSILDQAIRILQAMIDVAADEGWLAASLNTMCLVQMLVQGRWLEDCTLLTLPWVEESHLHLFKDMNKREIIDSLPELLGVCGEKTDILRNMLRKEFSAKEIDEIHSTLCRLPQLNVSLAVQGIWAEEQTGQRTEKAVSTEVVDRFQTKWVPVHADQEYVIRVNLSRITMGRKRNDRRAHAPRFPKNKDEGWWFVLGEVDTGELVALKRVGYVGNRSTVSLAFYTPEEIGRKIFTLFIMSDAYLGMDQQYDIPLEVIEADIASQINSEITGE